MKIEKEGKTTTEKKPEIFSKSDVVELLNWIAQKSAFRPNGISSPWSNENYSPYCSIKTESIVNEFIEYKQNSTTNSPKQ